DRGETGGRTDGQVGNGLSGEENGSVRCRDQGGGDLTACVLAGDSKGAEEDQANLDEGDYLGQDPHTSHVRWCRGGKDSRKGRAREDCPDRCGEDGRKSAEFEQFCRNGAGKNPAHVSRRVKEAAAMASRPNAQAAITNPPVSGSRASSMFPQVSRANRGVPATSGK